MQSMKMMKKAQQGFTLIELMIVVAIIGILAAVAIPQYQNYTVRAKLANAVVAMDSLKTAVALCIQETGATTGTGCTEGTNGIPANTTFTATKEVASVAVTDGAIVETLASTGIHTDVNGKTITYNPVSGASNLRWNVVTNITNAAFSDVLTKNNVATVPAGGEDGEGGGT